MVNGKATKAQAKNIWSLVGSRRRACWVREREANPGELNKQEEKRSKKLNDSIYIKRNEKKLGSKSSKKRRCESMGVTSTQRAYERDKASAKYSTAQMPLTVPVCFLQFSKFRGWNRWGCKGKRQFRWRRWTRMGINTTVMRNSFSSKGERASCSGSMDRMDMSLKYDDW